MKKVLAAAGDPGGARALLAVLKYLSIKHEPFSIIDHGYLGREAPYEWQRISLPPDVSGDQCEHYFKDEHVSVFIFASSVADVLPLHLARIAKRIGVPVVHVLDHWGNYTKRLETDGKQRLLPDIYAVMDELALLEAKREGIPENILKITGHPCLSTIVDELNEFQNIPRKKRLETLGISSEKCLIVFISEPIEQDIASGHHRNWNESYTEKNILEDICDYFQPYSHEVQLGIVPHPRENAQILKNVWEHSCGSLEGGILHLSYGRQAIFLADGVIGMSSILLYEAWLIGRPVLNIPPPHSPFGVPEIFKKKEIQRLTDHEQWPQKVTQFMNAVQYKSGSFSIRQELELHRNAPRNVYKVIEGFLN